MCLRVRACVRRREREREYRTKGRHILRTGEFVRLCFFPHSIPLSLPLSNLRLAHRDRRAGPLYVITIRKHSDASDNIQCLNPKQCHTSIRHAG